MSSRIIVCSGFLDGLVTRRDRERRPTLDHHTLAVDHHGAGHCAAGPAVGHVHLDGGCVSAARRQAAGEVGDGLGDVRALLVEAVRVGGELKIRNLPSLPAATRESLSFLARISGFMGVLSCDITIWSRFLSLLVTRRDRERRSTLDHQTLAVDDHGAGHGSA